MKKISKKYYLLFIINTIKQLNLLILKLVKINKMSLKKDIWRSIIQKC